MRHFDVLASRDGRWWLGRVPALSGITQARKFSELPEMSRDLIAVTLDIPLDEIEVTIRVETVNGVDVGAALTSIREERGRAAAIEAAAARRTTALAHDLEKAGLSLREIGAVLGLSHQRVHQLVRR